MNRMFHSIITKTIAFSMLAVLVIGVQGGCTAIFPGTSFLTKMQEDFESDYAVKSKKVELLKPVPKNPEAVHLEIFLVEKPLYEPLMGNMLWREVDQIAGLDIRVRENLKKNGFRVGRVSTRPPVPLQSLLGLTTEVDEEGLTDSKGLKGREIFISPGAETILLTGSLKSKCQFRVMKDSGEDSESFTNANCVFRVQAERLQDGYAHLRFIPEVQHGENTFRHIATEDEWVGRTSQELTPFFHQQFELNLNIGEMAVISADPEKAGSMGNAFFLTYQENEVPKQRIMVVRLSEMKKMDPLYPDE